MILYMSIKTNYYHTLVVRGLLMCLNVYCDLLRVIYIYIVESENVDLKVFASHMF